MVKLQFLDMSKSNKLKMHRKLNNNNNNNDNNKINNSICIITELSPGNNFEVIAKQLIAENICDVIELRSWAENSNIEFLANQRIEISINHPANLDTLKRQAVYKKFKFENNFEIMDKIINATKYNLVKNLYWNCCIEEDSSGVAYPSDMFKAKPQSKDEAFQLFIDRLTAIKKATSSYPLFKTIGMAGFASSCHQYALAGFDIILLERGNDDVDDFQTGIAFLRGACRQYKKAMGIDLSFWWGPLYSNIINMKNTYHERLLYKAYYSGAEYLRIEGIEDLKKGKPISEKSTSFLSSIKKFRNFSLINEQGKPYVPVAVIIPEDEGFMTTPYWEASDFNWNYAKIASGIPSKGIKSLFTTLFPGSSYECDPFPFGSYKTNSPPSSPFALSNITMPFCISEKNEYKATDYVNFGTFTSRDKARDYFISNNIDISKFRFEGCSKFGNIFDVFTDKIKINILSDYKFTIITGNVLFKKRKKSWLKYVENGGIIMVCPGIVNPADLAVAGIQFNPVLKAALYYKDFSNLIKNSPYRYCPVKKNLLPENTKIFSSSPQNEPLGLLVPYGNGYFAFCAVPWYLSENNFSDISLDLLNYCIKNASLINVEGPPIQWFATDTGSFFNIAISNNYDYKWSGKISIKKSNIKSVESLSAGKKIDFYTENNMAKIEVKVNSLEFSIYKIHYSK